MAKITLNSSGNFEVAILTDADSAELRVALKSADGADEVAAFGKGAAVVLASDNPFNSIALWGTEFHWDGAALKVAFDCLAPLARNTLHIHSRSHRSLMTRMFPKPPLPPATGKEQRP